MAPYYVYFCAETGVQQDVVLLAKMIESNAAELKKFDDKLLDAEQNLGETEVSETLIAKAHHLASIGEKVHKQNSNNNFRKLQLPLTELL